MISGDLEGELGPIAQLRPHRLECLSDQFLVTYQEIFIA